MKKLGINFLRNLVFLFYLEIVFQLSIFDSFDKTSIISISIFTLLIAFIITLITNLFSEKINKIINYITYFVLFILYSVQLIFKNFMNTFFSFNVLGLSDQALDFGGQVVKLLFQNVVYLILFLIPFILLIIFRKKIDLDNYGNKIKTIIIGILAILFTYLSFLLFLNTQKGIYLSVHSLYYEVNQNELNVQKLGVLNSYHLDIKRLLFGFEEKIKIEVPEEIVETNYSYNILDIDTNSLKDKLDNNTYNYISNNIGSKQNEYTGMFKGKNLIYIVAEAFNEIAISEELTPTLYKLTNSGFTFNNFYTPNYLSTIGGEFQALTGLIPDKSTLGIWRSGKNTFPFGLATAFKNMGYNTFAYHNHSGYFQNRNIYLKSQGFTNFNACYLGLEKKINCNRWPESDEEMINATVSDYITSDKPFMTYYMTVSGHLAYNWWNSMANKHKDEVKNLPYSEEAKAYLATQIELDKALEDLIKKLEENKVLDDTVIVLLADHYPYGLPIDNINELSTYKRDEVFEVNHNKLIIWNNKMETINIDKTCMSIDVIPTVYNLFGIPYDSRLFAGTDILSTTEGLVIFQNRSWITNKAIYNSSTNKYTSLDESVDQDYVNRINNIVSSKITFSKNMLLNNYYKYIEIP